MTDQGSLNKPRKGGKKRTSNTAKDIPKHLLDGYRTDPDETAGEHKSRLQCIRRNWSEEWFFYRFMIEFYEEMHCKAFVGRLCIQKPCEEGTRSKFSSSYGSSRFATEFWSLQHQMVSWSQVPHSQLQVCEEISWNLWKSDEVQSWPIKARSWWQCVSWR